MYIYVHIYIYIYTYLFIFAITNVARQQIFTLHGLVWKDYDEEIANEMLEEILSMNREKHKHEDYRKIHPTIAALSTYFYVQDHGATITRTTTDNETITKTADLKKKKDFEALGLSSASSSAGIAAKKELFIEKKQLQAASIKIKALQYQALKVSTDLAVKGMSSQEWKDEHDKFEIVIKTFNEFAISIMVGIGEIDGTEGEHNTSHIYIYIEREREITIFFSNIRVCLLLRG